MSRPPLLVLLACLGACSSTAGRPAGTRPSLTTSLPVAPATHADSWAREDTGAPNDTTLPLGIGLTFGPSAPMIATALDFPMDKQITLGPSIQYAFEDDLNLTSITGQLKYYLPREEKDAKLLPYLTIGAGMATIDKEGRGGSSGFLIDVGGGVRLLTGEHYRVGSELRWNWLPNEVANESGYFSWELLHIVISF
ncbi:MAG TPA: hypothetical protein VF384_11800 [Planctomycetota bacterium]